MSWILWKLFIKFGSNVCLSEMMCRTHSSTMQTQGQGHNWRPPVWALNFEATPLSFCCGGYCCLSDCLVIIWWLSTQFICFMTGGHVFWLPRQHSVFQMKTSKPLKRYDSDYAPNFKEVGGAYCFWVVRPSVCPSVRPSFRPSVRSSSFLMHSITLKPWMLLFWNFIYGFLMKK